MSTPSVVAAMRELGIDLADREPHRLDGEDMRVGGRGGDDGVRR